MTEVAVIGGGNVGCALAADLSLRGHGVRLCTRSENRIAAITEARGITLTGALTGTASPAVLTTDLGAALRGADVVAVTVPTNALPEYRDALVENMTVHQLLWLNPGHSGGALYLAAAFAGAGRPAPALCQLTTASHGSRMAGPAMVGVGSLPKSALAALPSARSEECHARVDELLPGQFHLAPSVLHLDLTNVNAVMHPAQMVCNASWIESTAGQFPIYADGVGPALGRVIDAIDAERVALAAAFGAPTASLTETLHAAGFTPLPSGPAREGLLAAPWVSGIQAPAGLDHRYLHEDVGWGLVPWVELAGVCAAPTPAMSAVTELAGIMNAIDYRRVGLTLDKMGLAGLTPDQIVSYVERGSVTGACR